MARATIISAADELYFPLLKGLILSVLKHRSVALSVIDVGMNPAQLRELGSLGANTVPGRWDFDFPGQGAAPRWMQAQFSRCRFPDYFPDYDMYIWIDCDAWLQDWRAIDLLLSAAGGQALAVVPEIHRFFPIVYRIRFTPRCEELYAASFGEEIAARLRPRPVFNSGVFACRKDSPVWKSWAKWMEISLKGRLHKLTEQNALNAAIYLDDLPFFPLPAWCNWNCGQAKPAFDRATGLLVEPILPHEPLSIVHVSPREFAQADIAIVGGGTENVNLDYLPFSEARPRLMKRE